ncbi:MAG TPA: FAD-dependent oxidoreductase [Streptosporangiaceae bacterium]|nr:FAD-dependent oxidoreductase [Streptosporangiaceae bacterium]
MTIQGQPGGHRPDRPRAAVVGAGVAGLTAAYLLQRAYDVTLYEGQDRLGGHAHTHDIPAGDGRLLALDSGFLVHNTRTYPNLIRLFGELGVATKDAEMSMSVRCEGCGLEYAGSRGPLGLFPAMGSVARPEYLAALAAVPGFYRDARRLLASPGPKPLSLGEFLRQGGYRRYFVTHLVIPLVAAVWSCPPAEALVYPARYLFEFLDHHGMLRVARSPGWRTVTGGSRSYVDRIAKQLTTVAAGVPVRAIRRVTGGVDIYDDGGGTRHFTRAVIATHPDEALHLLDAPTAAEKEVLGAFRYTSSQVVLHTDGALLPRAKAARASWNYLLRDCSATAANVHVSYHLNRLQGLHEPADYLVTLNPFDRVRPDRVLARMTYGHPVYDQQSVAAQRRLPGLNTLVLAYAGAYHGWGFHEDGCRSGIEAARALGVDW